MVSYLTHIFKIFLGIKAVREYWISNYQLSYHFTIAQFVFGLGVEVGIGVEAGIGDLGIRVGVGVEVGVGVGFGVGVTF